MERLRLFLLKGIEDRELLLSTSRKVIVTIIAIYTVWHIIATLGWPAIFSPSLWSCTLIMAVTAGLTLRLLDRHFLIAQAIWFTGLTLITLHSYNLYRRPEVTFFLVLLPMIAEVTLNLRVTVIVEAALLALLAVWGRLSFITPLPEGYNTALALLSLGMTSLGWGLSDNLISAIETSSYHYHEALKRLEEARQHRAEISVLLKEVNKANYQLDRLNKMLSYARARAEEAREERDRFAMAVSHELRSPLNFIIGYSDLMVNSPETYTSLDRWPPGLYDDVQEIYRSSNHLMGLINDILDMGKIDAQQMTLFREKIEIKDILNEVREMVEPAVLRNGLNFSIVLEDGLPPLYVDRTRIRQVLLNLVTNALRFTNQGSITLRARRESAAFMRLEVQDTGIGIAEEDLPRIFNEFRQAGSQNWRRSEGSGLGLAIGRRFVQLHGGEMGVESEPGRGSIFHFTLPIQNEEDELEILNAERLNSLLQSRETRSPDEKKPLLLFLAEDLFWARVFAELIDGFKITILKDPEQLLPVTNQTFPRGIIVDEALADHEAVRSIQKNPPYDLPVITLPVPVNLNRVTALPHGVAGYLIKPVSRQTLVETVRNLGPQARTLLVVDDDPAMVRFVLQSLRAAEVDGDTVLSEYTLFTAFNGSEALYHLYNDPIDAVLLDLELPDMNGLTLVDQMQQDEHMRTIPVVIISANDLPQTLSTEQQNSLHVTLNRPFSRKEVGAILSTVLENLGATYAHAKQPEEAEKVKPSED